METAPEAALDLLEAVLEWRSLHKRRGTYLAGTGGASEGFKGHIRPDNRIHFSFNVLGAATQRLSSQDPNGQNIPTKVEIPELKTKNAFRRTFIAPKGHVLMEADWSQLELWVLAYKLAEEFGDRALLDMLESGQDVHTIVSRAIWPEIGADLDDFEWQKEHEGTRRDGKVFTFGITYGMTIIGIMERLRCSEAVAASHLATYFGMVPGLPAYIEDSHRGLRAGETAENVWGMRRRFPEATVMLAVQNQRVNHAIEDLYRIRINWPIQSGGGGLHNLAHIKSEQSEQLNERAKIVNAVHDSCLFETPAPDLATCLETAWMIKNFWQNIAMNTVRPNGEKLGWQVPVEVKWGHDWGDLHHVLSAKGEYLDVHEKERERAEDAQAAEAPREG
jgi:DNA polymerase-1